MVYDDKPTKIGDYVFKRHEGVLYCYPFFKKNGEYDDSKKLEYSCVDMLWDLDGCFKSFAEEYKQYSEDNRGLNIKLTITEWLDFFSLALHESVNCIGVSRIHDENKKYSWISIKSMILPYSTTGIDILNLIDTQETEDYMNSTIGIIENESEKGDEIIITSIVELSLEELEHVTNMMNNYSLVKLDNSGFIKYYVFKEFINW